MSNPSPTNGADLRGPQRAATGGGFPADPEPWLLWRDGVHSPALCMALDEALLLTARERGRPVLRFYDWDRPAVSIGYVQRFDAAPRHGYAVVRRPTGGGVVYHDVDLTYTVVVPPSHWLTRVDRVESYAYVNRGVIAALAQANLSATLSSDEIPREVDRATMVCFTNPTRYDVMSGSEKLAGAAQRRTRDGILHQGSVKLDRERFDREGLVDLLVEGMSQALGVRFTDFASTPELLARARELAASRYACDDFTRRR